MGFYVGSRWKFMDPPGLSEMSISYRKDRVSSLYSPDKFSDLNICSIALLSLLEQSAYSTVHLLNELSGFYLL